MTIGDKIRDEKLQNCINREVAKILASSFRKNDKQKYLTGQEILPSNQKKKKKKKNNLSLHIFH